MKLIDHSRLSPDEIARIEELVSTHRQLSDVLNCAELARGKPLKPEIVTQDEYTHDIIVELKSPIYLVYDTN